jgi:hypothetical protein
VKVRARLLVALIVACWGATIGLVMTMAIEAARR